ncbi:MAG: hypothetical protein HN855_14695 [Anaerolineae bacterium]|jgi:hypothetical protein|nr:hypothetical protein [Anaerolineae bacterium]MBT7070876.1 hypothetical protein [Anaerolineae bacterium]MBT7326404.1 hypothetical protein [Anaerolineae bacterium]
MKEDRFLVGILIAVTLLVVASLAVFFTQKGTITYLPEDTPEGIVHNYVLALQEGDYERAYAYLADKEHKPSYDTFQRDILSNQMGVRDAGIQVNDVIMLKDTAQVELTMIEVSSGLFPSDYRYTEIALLIEQNGAWKLLQMPYFYWSWNWYQAEE